MASINPTRAALRFLSGPELYDLQKDFFTQDYDINKASLSGSFPTLDAYLNFRLPTEQDVANGYGWSKYAFVTTDTKEANISASGGNDGTKYYMGATYYNEQSTGVATGLTRKKLPAQSAKQAYRQAHCQHRAQWDLQ